MYFRFGIVDITNTLYNEHFRAGKLFLVGAVINHVPGQPVSAFLIVPPDSKSTIYNGASCVLASPLSCACTSLVLCIQLKITQPFPAAGGRAVSRTLLFLYSVVKCSCSLASAVLPQLCLLHFTNLQILLSNLNFLHLNLSLKPFKKCRRACCLLGCLVCGRAPGFWQSARLLTKLLLLAKCPASGKAPSTGLSAGRLASEQAPDVSGGRGRGGAWHSTGRLASEQAASD